MFSHKLGQMFEQCVSCAPVITGVNSAGNYRNRWYLTISSSQNEHKNDWTSVQTSIKHAFSSSSSPSMLNVNKIICRSGPLGMKEFFGHLQGHLMTLLFFVFFASCVAFVATLIPHGGLIPTLPACWKVKTPCMLFCPVCVLTLTHARGRNIARRHGVLSTLFYA